MSVNYTSMKLGGKHLYKHPYIHTPPIDVDPQDLKTHNVLTHKRNSCSHSLSCVQLFVTPWTAAHHAPLSIGFLRQKYHIGLLFPPPGDLLDPGMEPKSLYLLHCRQILYHCITWEADPQMHCLKHSVCLLSRFSRVQPFVTTWTVAHQAPLSMEFSRQEYWSGIPFSRGSS